MTTHHGLSLDAETEFMFTHDGTEWTELLFRQTFAGQPDTAATWSAPVPHVVLAGAQTCDRLNCHERAVFYDHSSSAFLCAVHAPAGVPQRWSA